jgi:hypothetical protein
MMGGWSGKKVWVWRGENVIIALPPVVGGWNEHLWTDETSSEQDSQSVPPIMDKGFLR